jgi:1-deoxy-D-xylulose-5-phosphate reductoisomerase
MKQKKLTILGCTGSIGVNTLEVVRQFPHHFQVVGLAAGRNIKLLAAQIREFHPRTVSVLTPYHAGELALLLGDQGNLPAILSGAEGHQQVAAESEADLVVSAIVGAAGLLPTMAAIKAGKKIALANKETLVIGGELVTALVAEHHVEMLPVDSEHSAIFQALQGNHRESLRRILLTASGGPFFQKDLPELALVTPEAALKHPNWSMGPKVTIDSATLMNKGLEVIEAHWLFKVPVEKISVHIHPESIVHSMVEYVDGSVIAQLGIPDMKIPIAYALSHPERLPLEVPALDLFQLGRLSFYPPDPLKFPCLRLAIEACGAGGTMPAVLNAANEEAVEAFLGHRLKFLEIPLVIEKAMAAHRVQAGDQLEKILEADRWARQQARRLMEGGGLRG